MQNLSIFACTSYKLITIGYVLSNKCRVNEYLVYKSMTNWFNVCRQLPNNIVNVLLINLLVVSTC